MRQVFESQLTGANKRLVGKGESPPRALMPTGKSTSAPPDYRLLGFFKSNEAPEWWRLCVRAFFRHSDVMQVTWTVWALNWFSLTCFLAFCWAQLHFFTHFSHEIFRHQGAVFRQTRSSKSFFFFFCSQQPFLSLNNIKNGHIYKPSC